MKAFHLFAVAAFAVLVVMPVHGAPIKIVAAENFYGGVAKQVAGDNADIISILSNPNQDPHEFTTNAETAKAVADADIVIYSGIGYDDWMAKLLATQGKSTRVVINVSTLIHAKNGDNPHIWYDPRTMQVFANRLAEVLAQTDAPHARNYNHNVIAFKISMSPVQSLIDSIYARYQGTTVTATEPVFGYMADALGFKMLNYDFQLNIMNDTEPSAAQTVAFENSLTSHTAKLLFYNSQVTDPTTDRIKKIAQQAGIPIIGVTETQPPDAKNYVDWMQRELKGVEDGLSTLKQETPAPTPAPAPPAVAH
jgi:zinc/manganese transport system substrate-binding protein